MYPDEHVAGGAIQNVKKGNIYIESFAS